MTRRPTLAGVAYRARHAPRGFLVGRRADRAGRGLLASRGVRVIRSAPDTRLVLGDRVSLHEGVAFHLNGRGAQVDIGDGTSINRRTELVCMSRITIGRDCAIGWDVLIMDTHAHLIGDEPPGGPVTIGDHVWIGAKAIVLRGVTIGDGAIVGAGSTVTRDVPPRSVVAGVPARVLREDVDWRDGSIEALAVAPDPE